LRDFFCSRISGLILKKDDFCAQKRAFLIKMHNFKALAAFGHDVHAAIGIFFSDRNDFRGAADFGDPLFLCPNHSKGFRPGQALGNHLLVAGLENVQRKRGPRKQNYIERKQGQKSAQRNLRIS
jgi:hypothetical protein